MEFPLILLFILFAAIVVGFVVHTAIKRRHSANSDDYHRDNDPEEFPTDATLPTPAPVKGVDHLAPKPKTPVTANDWRQANGFPEATKPAEIEQPKGPTTPPNNTYYGTYGSQPRIPRQNDSTINPQSDANLAFLALIAAQQAQSTADQATHIANGAMIASQQAHPSSGEASDTYGLSTEDQAWAEANPKNTPAEVEADEIHVPTEEEAGNTEDYWDSQTDADYDSSEPVIEEKFDYNSADNASTYNSTTDNGSDSGSSSSSSSSSSYDSGSSSSSDSGSSSSSSDSGSGGGGGSD